MRTYAINNTRIFKARFKYCCIADLRTAFLHNLGTSETVVPSWRHCVLIEDVMVLRRNDSFSFFIPLLCTTCLLDW